MAPFLKKLLPFVSYKNILFFSFLFFGNASGKRTIVASSFFLFVKLRRTNPEMFWHQKVSISKNQDSNLSRQKLGKIAVGAIAKKTTIKKKIHLTFQALLVFPFFFCSYLFLFPPQKTQKKCRDLFFSVSFPLQLSSKKLEINRHTNICHIPFLSLPLRIIPRKAVATTINYPNL